MSEFAINHSAFYPRLIALSRMSLLVGLLVLTACAKPDKPDQQRFEQALEALVTNNQSTFAQLIERTPNLLEWQDESGFSLIHYSITFQREEFIPILHRYAPPLAPTDQKYSPLILAIMQGNISYINWLISTNVNTNQPDQEYGITPLMYALRLIHQLQSESLISRCFR